MVERGFKGVWIPAEIWENKDLTLTEKCLLVEIDSLDKDGEGCFASNKHLATFIDKSSKYVSNMISSLRERGYLSVSLFRNENQEIEKRIIRVIPIHKNMDTLSTKMWQTYPQKNGYPIHKNVEESNTNTSNTINNINNVKNGKKEKFQAELIEIVEYYNQRLGVNRRTSSESVRKPIIARLNEGYHVQDFKNVVDLKLSQWSGNPKTEAWLQPKTLFGPKMENYVQEVARSTRMNQPTAPTKFVPTQADYDALNHKGGEVQWL